MSLFINEILNNFLLGIWLPITYIIFGLALKNINKKKLFNTTLILFILSLNWLYVGRLQNVHVIGISVLALYLFPPKFPSPSFIVVVGIALTSLIFILRLIESDYSIRISILFGPNTDALLLILMLSPILSTVTFKNTLIYLLFSSLIVYSTQSRNALILIIPGLLFLSPSLGRYLRRNIFNKSSLSISSLIYLFIVVFVYIIYQYVELFYLSRVADLESRTSFLSVNSDLDRMNAFLIAEKVFKSSWYSVFFGTDILPAVTFSDNVIHSEQFSILFGGGLILFIAISMLLIYSIFNVKSYFSSIYIFFYLFSSGFSTNQFSFPFLYMVVIFLNGIHIGSLNSIYVGRSISLMR